jgi:hypothetical protein
MLPVNPEAGKTARSVQKFQLTPAFLLPASSESSINPNYGHSVSCDYLLLFILE